MAEGCAVVCDREAATGRYFCWGVQLCNLNFTILANFGVGLGWIQACDSESCIFGGCCWFSEDAKTLILGSLRSPTALQFVAHRLLGP